MAGNISDRMLGVLPQFLPLPLQTALAAGATVRGKMLESGGEMPPVAAVRNTLSPEVLAQAPSAANLAGPAPPMSALERVLDNMVAADPDAKLTFGQLQQLGSVFPGTPMVPAPRTAKDAAGYRAMQFEDTLYAAAEAHAKTLSQAEADSYLTAAAERRKQLSIQLATGTTEDEVALAREYAKGRKKDP